ncbi:MAG: hypothetical protein U1E60_24180 [Reyranellaceae bacterium]
MSEKSLWEIFAAIALADHLPTTDLKDELTNLTGKTIHELDALFTAVCDQVKGSDPFAPLDPMLG